MAATYLVAGARTPIGKFGGVLKDISPVDLGVHVMQAAITRAGIQPGQLDLYIFGNILKHGHGQLMPRHAAIKAGIPAAIDGYAVDMLCSSGMMAVMDADRAIRAGDAQLVLAGGIESMSQAPFLLSHRARWGYRMLAGRQEPLLDALLADGLTDPLTGESMGAETERLSAEHRVTRAELDEVSYLSHARAAAATAAGKFQAELAPIEIFDRKQSTLIDKDEGIRPETTPETLAGLRASFHPEGVLTAGNSSQISDGAAALVLASEQAVQDYGLQPLARIVGSAYAGVESWRFVEGAVLAVDKLMARLDARVADFDLFENNEAFALNNVLLQRMLGIPYDKTNVYGGAIALGHPIGASGARIILTLANALRQEGKARGVASLCHGIGGGTAVALELVG